MQNEHVPMKNVSQKKKGNTGVVQLHMEQPTTPLIKSKHDDKSENNVVNIKLRWDPTSEKLGLYEFEMALFDISNPEEFLLFVRNFNMTLKVSGTFQADTNTQYLRTLVRGEVLCQFDTLSSDV